MAGNQVVYHHVDGGNPSIPSSPPDYDDLETFREENGGIEEFEIEEGVEEEEAAGERETFLVRASFVTKKLANNFNNRVIHPVSRMIDPIHEGYKYFHNQYEKVITKLGNPLVVKRLFYVLFIMVVIFLVTKYNSNDGVSGSSGGTFTSGKFYDIDKLGDSLREYIEPKVMKENLEYLSSMPHLSGTTGDLVLAKYIHKYFKENGIRSLEFDELQSFTNYPKYDESQTYVKLADGSFSATLYEMNQKDMEYLAFNPNSLNTHEEIESFYIYGNFGTPEDFELLSRNEISLKNSILLIKYGGNFPEANKVQLAHQNEAKAVVFITPNFESSDSNDIHYEGVIQRLNVGLFRSSVGDVLTPGWSSDDGYVTRLPWFKSQSTPKIPSIPISWEDGKKFIQNLATKGVKFDDETYSGVPSTEKSQRIKFLVSNVERPTHHIWNVIGSIPGREQLDKGILIGASRDSNCFGTLSTNTGTVVLLELVKMFTTLQRQYSWLPSRSIYFISFDASEYNLAGLSEWIESRKTRLQKEGFTYVDISDAVSGNDLLVKANPFLHEVIKDALKKVGTNKKRQEGDDNTTLLTKKDNNNLYDLFKSLNDGQDKISNNMIEFKNYLSFINVINTPSMEVKFTGYKYPENSCFDNFENFERAKIDPSMENHKQLVELLSLIILNLAELPIIPYNFLDMTASLTDFVKDLDKYAEVKRLERPESNIQPLDVQKLSASLESLKEAANTFHSWCNGWRQLINNNANIEPSMLSAIRWKWNQKMTLFNQRFLAREMQPKRQSYVNLLLGSPFNSPSNLNLTYEWNSFPLVRDYLDAYDFDRAQSEVDKIADLIRYSSEEFVM